MGDSRSIRLLVVDDGAAKLKEVRLSVWKIVTAICLLVVLGGVTVYGAGYVISLSFTRKAMAEVVAENDGLREHLTTINTRLAQVDTILTQLSQSDDQLRMLADLPQISGDTREVGIGGTGGASGTDDYLNSVGITSEDEAIRSLVFNLDKIEREIRLQNNSFLEIKRQLSSQEDVITHTPSIRPIDGGFYASNFGYRRDPFTRRRAHHEGLDLVCRIGTPVHATADGIVISAERASGFGKVVVIDHGYGYRTLYAHLSGINVNKGQTVTRGDKIGQTGNTGRSTGPHLHYEVHINKRPVNPADYVFSDDFASERKR